MTDRTPTATAYSDDDLAVMGRAIAIAVAANDDSARVAALQRALRQADDALAEAARALASPDPRRASDAQASIESARHEARVALSLDHGEA